MLLLFALAAGAPAIPFTTVLERMQDRWDKIDDFTATLLQERAIAFDQQPHAFVGRIMLARPNALRVESRKIPVFDYHRYVDEGDLAGLTVSPTEEIVYYNGDYWYTYWPAKAEILKEATLTHSFLPVLAAVAGVTEFDPREMAETHSFDAPREEELLGHKCYLLRMEPKKGRADYKYIQFWVDRETYLPVKIVMKQDTASLETYVFNPKVNSGLSPGTLKLGPFPAGRVPRLIVTED